MRTEAAQAITFMPLLEPVAKANLGGMLRTAATALAGSAEIPEKQYEPHRPDALMVVGASEVLKQT